MAKRKRVVPRKVDVEAAIVMVGANIRRIQLDHEMTQQQAADLANINWRHWQKIEYAETCATVPSIVRIAAALGVDVGELLATLR